MQIRQSARVTSIAKAPTGIAGLDEITGGGLPRGRATLLVGGPGSGKTVLALQFLAHGAIQCDEPGIFVALEESAKRILANTQNFGWKLASLQRKKKLYILDAQTDPNLVQSGDFDLGGLLSALEVKVRETGARRIVFDALDMPLALLPDVAAQRREIYRLHAWLVARDLTAVITLKSSTDESVRIGPQPFGFMQFMVDCVVLLTQKILQGVSQRILRVQKYRGSSFDENESPFLIGPSGFEIAAGPATSMAEERMGSERISSGVSRLDTMLGGGYYRCASVLITGESGTAKTTLCGAFAQSACERNERTLFVCFDTVSSEVVRNLSSVGIVLEQHVKSGLLRMVSARDIAGSAETYLLRIKALANDHAARCVVIDPASAWSKSGMDMGNQGVTDRLIDWAKGAGVTFLCTSMFDEMSHRGETGTPLQITALVDTWIHLNYLMQAGERNRGLSVIKSRGTTHSNQVRELILSDAGVTLADTYTAGGEVLMGTLRWEKERAANAEQEATTVATKLTAVKLDAQEADLEVRLKSLQTELIAKQVEKALLARVKQNEKGALTREQTQMKEMRGADAAPKARS